MQKVPNQLQFRYGWKWLPCFGLVEALQVGRNDWGISWNTSSSEAWFLASGGFSCCGQWWWWWLYWGEDDGCCEEWERRDTERRRASNSVLIGRRKRWRHQVTVVWRTLKLRSHQFRRHLRSSFLPWLLQAASSGSRRKPPVWLWA